MNRMLVSGLFGADSDHNHRLRLAQYCRRYHGDRRPASHLITLGYRTLEAAKPISKRFFGNLRQRREFRRFVKFSQEIRRFSLDSPLKLIQDAIALPHHRGGLTNL